MEQAVMELLVSMMLLITTVITLPSATVWFTVLGLMATGIWFYVASLEFKEI